MTSEENYFLGNTDIQYHFNQTIPWEKLVALVESNYRQKDGFKNLAEALEFYREILTNVGKFVPKEVLPRSPAIDREGNHFKDGEVQNPKELDEIIQKCKELGLHSLIQPREFGGLNAPFTIQCMLIEMFCRVDISAYTNISYYNAISQFLFMFSLLEGTTKIQNGTIIQTRFQKAIEDITAGNVWGAMVLTEPNAGSDLGNLQTKAVFNGTHWVMNGRKIFITEGHGEHHIVLARTADAKAGGLGLDGLSLFYVPRHRQTEQGTVSNFMIEGIEHKIGLHGSPTCSLVYENAYAELIGEQGQGFTQMVRMMNGFRLGVGFQCLGVLQGAFSMAKAYAETRVSMGKPIIDHELIADMLFNMELDLCGLRALAYRAVSEFEISQREEIYLEHDDFQGTEAERKQRGNENRRRKRYVRRLTPLLKYLGSEKAIESCRMNMQIHGGFGYTQEYSAERLLRDSLVLPVYEGTSQIQALMILKDEMKNILKRPWGFCKKYIQSSFYFIPFQKPYVKELKRGRHLLFKSFKRLLFGMIRQKRRKTWTLPGGFWKVLTFHYLKKWDMKTDFSFALLHAERICRMMAKMEIAKILAEEAGQFPERAHWAEQYLKKVIPEIVADASIIREGSFEVLHWIERNKKTRRSVS